MSTIAVVANTEKITKKEAGLVRRSLAAAGFTDVKWHEVKHGSASKPAAEKAIKHGAETILVCGGDGTVRAAAEAIVGTSTRLAVLPRGTANLFASGLGLPTKLEDVVAGIVGGDRHRIDTALCNGHTFNVMAGVGWDVGMLEGAEDEKEKLGTLAYVVSSVREARHRELFSATINVDGEEFYEGPASCVLVGNVGKLKGGVEAFPGATATDGKLHVAVVTATGLREWAGLLTKAIARKQRSSQHAQMGEGTSITVAFDEKHRFELDGGVKTRAKALEFEIRPRSLTICAPAA